MDVISLIRYAVNNLQFKLNSLDINSLEISELSRLSLQKYKENFNFYFSSYSRLLQRAFEKLNSPADRSVFVDYGGGCGLLSMLAKQAGFKTVIYNDINGSSVSDAKLISKEIGINIDHFITGEAEDFVNRIELLNISPDIICAFDVVEHIYDLERWIRTMSRLPNPQYILMTGANPKNPVITRRLKKLQLISEYKGCENNVRYDDMFLNTSFLEEREKILKIGFPQLKEAEVAFLANDTRGLRKEDIETVAQEYLEKGEINYVVGHPTNTCDPYTGSWTERLIDLKSLGTFCESNNMTMEITNSFYSYNNKRFLNFVKFFLNQMIKILGQNNLLVSPTITIEIKKSDR
ncbi:MAG: hypothetical protein A2X05_13200 [Bacteroidetes bacterium GWE2_41_25]|nr:MAG: hypothetical protein A2X03_15540 [Bacteroidetes bacterium GWA2_40_15]OFX98273.1 MAG: hypothetical protein A2X06_05430 [Bacteroidetes bacterium GWC2_40_22]OFY11235.1 MAG: hypothetical protein A2X05_13200 [Bacteroidetes bacterium GWE2_41_25]OFY57066.1 MAG: hypothetical protein A2X04_16510 [Bacteroidetes bacterium GWF2_41_9]HAM11216.1 hypothetical protein [Bacteroidales bacterium]